MGQKERRVEAATSNASDIEQHNHAFDTITLSPAQAKPRRGGRASRQKGDRIERQLVELHRSLGIHAERVPLSGATRYQANGADIDLYPFGRDDAPFCCEVKARSTGSGFKTLERWLGDNDALFLRRDRAEPLVVLPWRVWSRLLQKVQS